MTYDYGNTPAQPQVQQPTKTVVFGGRVTKDPELRMTTNNQPVINIDFAVNQFNGETHWGRATVWGTDAYIAADFCKKGEMIAGVADFKVTKRIYEGKEYITNEYNVQTLLLSAKDILKIVDGKIAKAIAVEPKVEQPVVEQPQAQLEPEHVPRSKTDTPTPPQPEPQVPAQPTTTIQIDNDELPF